MRGLLPWQWLLVGNGRGDITHENFRARVHDALTGFGPKPEGTDWDSFAQRVVFVLRFANRSSAAYWNRELANRPAS